MPQGWRIDDLARETGLTVDTIRYYQREGLLPPAAREGRRQLYAAEHIERLRRIKELQARRFSIAAIRVVLSKGDSLGGLFDDQGESLHLTFDELLERSGASPDLVNAFKDAGILREPPEFGRTDFDGDDLEMLRSMAYLELLGVSVTALGAVARIYATDIEDTQRRIQGLFAEGGGVEWAPGEYERLRDVSEAQSHAIVPALRQLVDYTHRRTVQRLTLVAVELQTDRDHAPT
jgi:hypothetical protein